MCGVSAEAVETMQVVFPPTLSAKQRAALHSAAEAAGLAHTSAGEGAQRHITVGAPGAKQVVVEDASGGLTDEVLCQLLQQHLSLDAREHFAQASNGATRKSGGGRAAGAAAAPGGGGVVRGAPGSVHQFISQTTDLLELERQAEVEAAQEGLTQCSPQTAQARGTALLNLRVSDAEGGLLGRTLLTLVSNRGFGGPVAPPLPDHRLSPHDIVALRASKGEPGGPPLCTGLVYRVREAALVVAVDDPPEEGLDQPLRVDKLANEVTYKRLRETLQQLARPSGQDEKHPGTRLVDVMFGAQQPRFAPASVSTWTPFNAGLDDSQRRAVDLALRAQDVALVHGPPGTGKTTAVVELVRQEVARGARVLAAAASNVAVDNLVERLAAADAKLRVVRVGHPARLLPQVLGNSLEAHVLRTDNSALARDCRAETKALNSQLLKLEPWKRAERRQLRSELRRLAKEERQRQEKAIAEVLQGAQVVCCTLTGCLHHHLSGLVFDVAVVDEAAQALEVATWSALLKAPRCVLAGDHLQLPPTVISDAAARRGLAVTLFERLQRALPRDASEMLAVQYRMNESISDWASGELYQGKLVAHETVASHTLATLPGPAAAPGSKATAVSARGSKGAAGKAKGGKASKAATSAPAQHSPVASLAALAALPVLLLLDTSGCGFEERTEEEGDSKANEGEARVVMAHVARLVAAGVPVSEIGVITPYRAQVQLLREMRGEAYGPALEVSTVDGFQGREKEAIVISMVRSNERGVVGFLGDSRRMNVAVTRARRHCAIVCDADTVGSNAFLKRLVTWVDEHGEYASAQELLG